MDLFSSEISSTSIPLPLKDAEVTYFPCVFSSEEAKELYEKLLKEIQWNQDDIKIFGKTYKQPRLTALYGNNEKPYRYSGITMNPIPFTSTLLTIKTKIEAICGVTFTSVLLNLYRDGNDSNGWHSDDEKELGKCPFIASASFGTTRVFHFKHKQDKNLTYKLPLEHGSVLIMKGTTQENWKHQLPKSKRITSPRINLTFRIIK